jgi:putative two-component system response regulator
MSEKILCVDDEPNFLSACQRKLRQKFHIDVASGGEAGLDQIRKNGPYAVVVCDLRMPGMNGIGFLSRVKEAAPDTVRIMLTGFADLQTAMEAVSEGSVFRFLSKPCPTDVLEKALHDGIRQYQLVQTEREFHVLKKWNESLGGIIQAFMRLVASKDPYTADHQLRVSQLSAAIARSLAFSDNTVEQITMAAMIHDIGKIYVPIEFLNKPGQLNSSELNIVKLHAQIGHDILKPISFSFPIHEIVLQHHEKIDGSGYPFGLKESEIMVEAKIIAVADMVEATAHHRPYRPAKGLEQAIIELGNEKGIRYDSRISDAAIALLTEGAFQFKERDPFQKSS